MNLTSNRRPTPPVTQSWVRFRSVGYLTGRGLAFGVGDDLFPRVATAPGKFSLNMDILPNPNVTVCDGRVDMFQDDAFDHLVVGPALGVAPNPVGLMRQLVGKLRTGGHVVLYFTEKPRHPAITTVFDENAALELLSQSGAWRLKCQITREGHTLVVAKKVAGKRGTVYPVAARATKRACIVRYGALGDMVMITPLIRALAEDGYEVTMNITPYAAPVVENNPFVSNIVIQEREAIPNHDLGAYWNEWSKDYDKYINLSESIEGKLLKVEGRRDYFTTKTWRSEQCGSVNYYDHTMGLGGYPGKTGTRGELFFTDMERRDAAKLRKSFGANTVIGWAMNGSSHHKLYPLIAPVLDEWLLTHPNVTVVLLGGQEAQRYEFDHPQVVKTCGTWSLRKTLGFIAMVADAMVGPESMAMNVAACYDKPKLTFLSHSSHDNLCKYWTNDFCLSPDTDIALCYPCHQLHYTVESCPQAELRDKTDNTVLASGPVCAMGAISGNRVMARLDEMLSVVTPTPTP